MDRGLLLIEKLVLSSIQKGASDVQKIQNGLKIPYQILEKILAKLMRDNFILFKTNEKTFDLEFEINRDVKIDLSLFSEADIKSMISHVYAQRSKLQRRDWGIYKIWLSKNEEKELNIHLAWLKSFLEEKNRNSKKQDLNLNKSEKFIFFGQAPFQLLLQNGL